MLRRLTYIWMILLTATLQVAGQSYVIDEVCRGADRSYRVEGEQGSSWEWNLLDETNNQVDLSTASIISFSDTNSDGDPIYGSEISINWDYAPAIYTLSVIQTSSFGCDSTQLGTIQVYPAPEADAGEALSVCAGFEVEITEATAANYTDVLWITDGDGTFDDQSILNPIYTPGINDIAAGTVNLTLTANGLISGTGCLPAESNVEVTIHPVPVLIITDPDPVCEPEPVDLTDAAVTAGSDAGLTFTYWNDVDTTDELLTPDAVVNSGTYYIRGENETTGCFDIKEVEVVINPQPILVINNPDAVCEPTTIDLSVESIISGSTIPAESKFSYWADADTTISLVNYTAIDESNTYYIKVVAPGGCFDIKPVEVIVHPLPLVVISEPDPVCEPDLVDLTNDAITTGSDAGLTFTYWNDIDATDELLTPNAINATGTYYIKGENPLTSCSDIKEVKVTIHPIPNLVINDPVPVCEPTTIDLSIPEITNGSDPDLSFTYWQDIDATVELTNYNAIATSGTYYIKATNPITTCEKIKEVHVTVYDQPLVVTHDPVPVCEPTTIDLTLADVTDGSDSGLNFTYWEDEDVSIPLTNYAAIDQGGTYYIKGTNPATDCFDVKPVVVTIYPIPTLDITDPDPVCYPDIVDLEDPSITLGSEAGLSLSYWEDENATIPLADYNAITTTGTYYIKGTNDATGCSDIPEVHVVINEQPDLTINNPDPVCEPDVIDLSDPAVLTGSIIPDSSDTTYWEDIAASTPLTNYTAVSESSTYYIRVEAPGGCSDIAEVEVVVNPLPTLVISDPEPICQPNTIDLTNPDFVDGSDAGLDYTYWQDDDATIELTNYTAVETSGTYYIKAEVAATGCYVVNEIQLLINEQPELVITNTDEICDGETVDISADAVINGSTIPDGSKFSYWANADTTISLPNYTAIDAPGTYYIKVQAPAGCFDVKAVEVVVNPLPSLVINDPPAVCEPETVDLSLADITSGSESGLEFTYWEDENTTVGLTNYNAVSESGTYYIQATNPTTGCKTTQPVHVTINPIPNLLVNDPPAICEPNTVDLTLATVTFGSEANLDFTYWEDEDGLIPLANYNAIPKTGTFYIKGSSQITGCESSVKAVNVIVNEVPVLVITDPSKVCEPETVDLTYPSIVLGSTIPDPSTTSYWTDAAATNPIADPENITQTGTYYIKVVAGSDCYDIEPVNVTVNKQPVLVVNDPDPVCEPDIINLEDAAITAGSDTDLPLTYWKDANATDPLDNYNAITASGIYYIKATKDGLCPEVKPVKVTINIKPVLVINDPPEVCEPEVINLTDPSIIFGSTYSGTPAISYWTDAAATQPVSNPATIDENGTYYIKMRAGDDCFDIAPVNVVVHPQPALTIVNPNPVCEPETIDLTDANYTPGVDPALIKTYWYDEAVNNEIADPTNITTGGTYYIKVTSTNNCDNIKPVQVIINKPDQLTFNMDTQFCLNSAPPALPATAQGGITGSWDPAIIATDALGQFEYTFTPDPGQCAIENTVQITITKQIIPIFDPVGPYCLGSNPPPLPTTSKNNITGIWSPANITTDQLGFFDYTFIPDPDQCAADTTIQLEINQTFDIYPSAENVDCKGDNTGSINLTISGGSGSYAFNWSNGKTTQNISNLYGGRYYDVTVIDLVTLCQNNASIYVSEPSINDNEAPVLTAPGESYVQCDASLTGGFTNITAFINAGGNVSDNMGYDPTTFRLVGETSREVNGLTITERRYSIADYCGNIGYATQTIAAKDDTKPTVVCNAFEISVDENGVYELTQADIEIIANGSTDNCTQTDDLILEFTPMRFECAMVGDQVTGTLIVTDQSGNSDSCQAVISITDKTPPVIVCQDVNLYLDSEGEVSLNIDDTITNLYDNCEIDTFFVDKNMFECGNVGENDATITAIDVHGLQSICDFKVFVHDTVKPTLTCNDYTIILDASEYFELDTSMVSGNYWDNCAVERVLLSQTEFGCTDVGITPVTITIIDVNGNESECIANITVSLDNEPPVANDDDGYVTVTAKPIAIAVLDNDTDNHALVPASLDVFVEPAHGSVTINSNHEFIYTSDPNFVGFDEFSYIICDEGIPCYPLCDTAKVFVEVLPPNNAPVANVDRYETGCYTINEFLLINDYDPDGDQIFIQPNPIVNPVLGNVTLFDNGDFRYEFERGISGQDWFIYEICDDNYFPKCDTAIVYIYIFTDFDCDNIPDTIDIDDDNDGIIDVDEGDMSIDSDGDGMPNSLDIDSDNDGIPDNIEAQAEGHHINPSGIDENENGLDDIYETDRLGIDATDTDHDNLPDYIDLDSDNDNVPDNIEGYDIAAKGIAEVLPEGLDDDGDGLDDAFDNFFGGFDENNLDAPYGTDPRLQDFDSDGIRDWRDTDDDNDDIPTRYEDLNNNGIYYDDDLDFDGHPEYLDYRGECEMFIPEGFSPDGDGIHDYFQIYCIDKYPNAKLMIFDRYGNMVYEKEHYGNREYWGSYGDSWWNGETTKNHLNSIQKVEPEVYLYILDKGNGKLERGFVMVSY